MLMINDSFADLTNNILSAQISTNYFCIYINIINTCILKFHNQEIFVPL